MSDGHITKEKNNYKVTVHPAFASRCTVNHRDNGECEVYKQDKPHKLNGQGHPKKHKIVLKGGPHNRDITIEIDDPHHAIHNVTLQLYGERTALMGSGIAEEPVETFSTDNVASTCPPVCDDNDPPTTRTP